MSIPSLVNAYCIFENERKYVYDNVLEFWAQNLEDLETHYQKFREKKSRGDLIQQCTNNNHLLLWNIYIEEQTVCQYYVYVLYIRMSWRKKMQRLLLSYNMYTLYSIKWMGLKKNMHYNEKIKGDYNLKLYIEFYSNILPFFHLSLEVYKDAPPSLEVCEDTLLSLEFCENTPLSLELFDILVTPLFLNHRDPNSKLSSTYISVHFHKFVH